MMRKISAVVIVFLLIVLTGSVFQTYEHTVRSNGESEIKKEFDIGFFTGMFEQNANNKIAQVCYPGSPFRCEYNNSKIVLRKEFSQSDGYYEFYVNYGIPFIDYEIVVRKIPTEKFSEMLDTVLLSAGVVNATADDYGKPIDIENTAASKEAATLIKQTGLDIKYVIIMPGHVWSASAGHVNASFEGERAEFLLSDVLGEAQPMVIKSRELNLSYILLISMIIVVAAFTLSFRKYRKG